jgi:HTH-like domain/Integrase core domain
VAALIAAQRDQHRIPHAVSCRALGVSQSWFSKWSSHARAGTLPPQAARRARLAAEVRRLFDLHDGKRGSPMITADLQDAGWRVSKNTVAALMAEQHLAARPKRRRRVTTRPGRGRWRAPDLVKRQFPATRLNHKWYGDGTEIPTGEGKLHLVSVMEAASRRILGFALSGRHDAAAAYGALAMAVTVRGGQVPGVIMHTDQGRNTPPGRSRLPAAGFPSPSRWGGQAPPSITRSSNRGTPPSNSSCGECSTSPPGNRPAQRWRPGSRTTTPVAGTRPARRCRQQHTSSCWQPGGRQPDHDPTSPARQYPPVLSAIQVVPPRA